MIAKLNVKALGLAMGILWSFAVLLLGLLAKLFMWGVDWVYLLSSVYIGYRATFPGILIGTLWGFVDGFIGGILLAWLYNKLGRRFT